jgi:hypothetical protein
MLNQKSCQPPTLVQVVLARAESVKRHYLSMLTACVSTHIHLSDQTGSFPHSHAHQARVLQLFMHMCEADVAPLLQDCAVLISSIAIDGKLFLAEMLFYYIFRHEAAFETPPPLSQAELASIPSRDLNVAYMLESATQRARAVYCPAPQPPPTPPPRAPPPGTAVSETGLA